MSISVAVIGGIVDVVKRLPVIRDAVVIRIQRRTHIDRQGGDIAVGFCIPENEGHGVIADKPMERSISQDAWIDQAMKRRAYDLNDELVAIGIETLREQSCPRGIAGDDGR